MCILFSFSEIKAARSAAFISDLFYLILVKFSRVLSLCTLLNGFVNLPMKFHHSENHHFLWSV